MTARSQLAGAKRLLFGRHGALSPSNLSPSSSCVSSETELNHVGTPNSERKFKKKSNSPSAKGRYMIFDESLLTVTATFMLSSCFVGLVVCFDIFLFQINPNMFHSKELGSSHFHFLTTKSRTGYPYHFLHPYIIHPIVIQ